MSLPATLVLLPSWLEKAINDKGESLKVALDIVSLSHILTAEDVAFYISINRIFQTVGPDWSPMVNQLVKSFSHIDVQYIFNNRTHALASEPLEINGYTVEDYKQRINSRVDGMLLEREGTYESSLKDLRYIYDLIKINPLAPTVKDFNFIYELVEITENVFGLRILPMNTELTSTLMANNININLYCYDNLLGLLCKFYRLSELTKTELFSGFVQECSTSN